MARTANIVTRVEPEIKEKAEAVLDGLGISMSTAMAIYLRQIALQRKIPFEMKLPEAKPIAYGALSDEEFNVIIEKGLGEYASGKVLNTKSVRKQMQKEFGI